MAQLNLLLLVATSGVVPATPAVHSRYDAYCWGSRSCGVRDIEQSPVLDSQPGVLVHHNP